MKSNEKKCVIFFMIVLGILLIHEFIKDVGTYGILLGIIVFIPTIIITIMAIECLRLLKNNKKEIQVYSDEEKCIKAYHEAGHSVLVSILKSTNKIKKLSIIPQDNMSLNTMFEIEELSTKTTDSEVEKMLLIMLGGRAAERVVVNNTFKTSNYDLEKATNLLTEFIKISNRPKEEFCVQEILENLENKAIQILTENKKLLDKIAKELVEKGRIYGADIEYIMMESIIEKNSSL